MKLFSILIDVKGHHIFDDFNKFASCYNFLHLKSSIRDLIWVNQIKVNVLTFGMDERSIIFSGLCNKKEMVSRSFDICQAIRDNYFIGFGYLVFRPFGDGITKPRIGYHNLIDFNLRFVLMDIL